MSAHSEPTDRPVPVDPPAPVERLVLAGDFPASSRDAWRELMSAVLAKSGYDPDVDPEAALATHTYDGIEIKPLYTAADAPAAASPVVGGRAEGWDVRQRHADPDPVRANQAILTDLTSGTTSLWLSVGEQAIAVSELGSTLKDVYLDLAPIALDAGSQTRAAAAALLALAAERGVDPAELAGSLGADPIGLRARTGADADLGLLAELAPLVAQSPNLCVATVDGTAYHDAGGSDSDELAIAASVGVAYLRALTASGLSVDAALAAVEFRYAVTADQFLSIAKLRAARRIWARIAELAGGAGTGRQRQHAVTSAAMMTQRDPWVNLLRTTIACFAAAVGGADAISVAPFDSAIGLPDDFARRIARNTSSVLHDEASLARVNDAAGGSWYVESLTDELARVAWGKFTALEAEGGALAALDSGTIGRLLAQSQAARADDIAHRRAPITGVSEFAFIGEQRLDRAAASRPAGAGPLPTLRYAADYEALRDRSDAAAQRPTVFLAALGPLAAHTARVGFATNLFAAAGVEVVVGTGGDDGELAAAFAASGTSVACICSSDKIYAEAAAPAVQALRDAGAQQIWLAGKAKVSENVDGNVFAGCDALAVLRSTLDTLGVPA